MSNTLLTISMITRRAMVVLENQLTFTKAVNRQYDDQFAVAGAKIGATVNARKPPQYITGKTPTIQLNGTTETSVPITLNNQYNVGLSFTSQEFTLDIDDFAERFLVPAIASMANQIDYDGLQLWSSVYQSVGTPGTTPTSLETWLSAKTKLDNAAAPDDMQRSVILNPIAQQKAVVAGQALFNPVAEISEQYRKGMIGEYANAIWSMDQNVGLQTGGVYVAAAGAVTVTTSVATGNSIVTGGWTSGDILNVGDIITFGTVGAAGAVYSANPQNRQSTGQLQQFVVTAQATASGGGAMTISVSPALQFSTGATNTNQFVNMVSSTNSIGSGLVVTPLAASAASSPQNLFFHRDAFTFATADLDMPMGAVGGHRVSSKKLGMSIRIQPFYDGINDRSYHRLDLLGGWAVLRPELACRVAG